MSQNAAMNQRRFERFNIFERAALVDESGKSTSVILVDVSLGGAQVLARDSFPDGNAVNLVVGKGNEATTIAAVIRYNKPGEFDLTAVGLKMTGASGEERVAIANLVNRIFMNPSEVPQKPAVLIDQWLGAA